MLTGKHIPTAVILALVFLIDLFYIGQGGISILVAVFGVTILALGCLWALIRGQRPVALSRGTRAALYVLLGAATLGTMRFHDVIMEANTNRIIEACRSYERAHGTLPDRLEDLVPAFLPAVPRVKYAYLFSDFNYYSTPEDHRLRYVFMPPFGSRSYRFETNEWQIFD